MASGQKLLIDTNVLIGLEDWKVIPPTFARLSSLCSKYGCHLYVHDSSIEDIMRDTNSARRATTLSKAEKFERLSGIKTPSDDILSARFGKISGPNDRVDVALLYALEFGAIDFLVTQDQGIHARARRASAILADRVLTVAEAVDWLVAENEPKSVHLPLVEQVYAHSINPQDDMFASLRDGYPEFDTWWKDKCVAEHRPCWVVTIDGVLAGIVVRKDETAYEGGVTRKGLKLCTFKVKPQFRGEKLGELLLKQALWFAQQNHYDFIYLTTFPSQPELVAVLEYYGFKRSGPDQRGELTLRKDLPRGKLTLAAGEDPFTADRMSYPRFATPPDVPVFCIPIRGEYHDALFPELIDQRQLSLFQGGGERKPGNTIRKIYLCRSNITKLVPGSIIAFYRSMSAGSAVSQSITTLGVVERVSEVSDVEELVRLTAKRSVYRLSQLQEMIEADDRPVKAIDFLLCGHLTPALQLSDLKRLGILKGPPQSISQLDTPAFQKFRPNLNFGFAV